MKLSFLFLSTVIVVTALTTQAQSAFPGISKAQMTKLSAAKKVTPIALPTWLPAGFKLEEINSKLGRGVKVYERELVIVYSRDVSGGKKQRFSIEAGFDGIGDLMFEPTKTLKTGVGSVILVYQPKDDDGKIVTDYAMTEWFEVGKTAFHYNGWHGEENDPSLAMISLADTEKILRSLKRL